MYKRQENGSSLFNQVVKNVPVLAPSLQAFVSRELRETSLLSMVGVPHDEDDGEQQKLKRLQQEDDDGSGLHQQDKADVEDISRAATKMKKRRLYKQLSGTDVPWFPHDNAIELLKELFLGRRGARVRSSTGHQRVAQAFMAAWRRVAASWPFATTRIIGPT